MPGSRKSTPESPPCVCPAVIEDRLDPAHLQYLQTGPVPIRSPVEHVGHATLDDQLGAHHARAHGDENDLVANEAGRLHECIHLRMDASAPARLVRVTAV